MVSNEILKGKKILAVDDEQDILDTLEEILTECNVQTATSFESAKELLETEAYDADLSCEYLDVGLSNQPVYPNGVAS